MALCLCIGEFVNGMFRDGRPVPYDSIIEKYTINSNQPNTQSGSQRPVERAQWPIDDLRTIERIVSGHMPANLKQRRNT